MFNIDQWASEFFAIFAKKNEDGTLTVGDLAGHYGYYRLLEGEHAGRVIIVSCMHVHDEPAVLFANGLTWSYVEKLKDVRCESVRPVFSYGKQNIDYSQATWYPDNSSEPQHHEW